LASSSRFWLLLYNPWLTFSFFHPKKFLNLYTFCSKKFFWVLSGYMQPKKRTLVLVVAHSGVPSDWGLSLASLITVKVTHTSQHPMGKNVGGELAVSVL
jgi:hypothetical protein